MRTLYRKEQIAIQTLGNGPSSTARSLINGNDERNYYSTLTTPLPPLGINDPDEYIYETEYIDDPDYYYNDKPHNTPAPILTTYKPKILSNNNNNNNDEDDYNIIGTKLQSSQNVKPKNRINTRPEIILSTPAPTVRTTAATTTTTTTPSTTTTTTTTPSTTTTTTTSTTTTTTTTPKPSTTKISKTTSPSVATTKSRYIYLIHSSLVYSILCSMNLLMLDVQEKLMKKNFKKSLNLIIECGLFLMLFGFFNV